MYIKNKNSNLNCAIFLLAKENFHVEHLAHIKICTRKLMHLKMRSINRHEK